jgi:serine/threonine protein kinase
MYLRFLVDIMLTINPSSLSTHIDLSALPVPLIKLTDFGLARFIDSDNPLLTTRCGSEYYAAPEIIMAKPYDGRETDAWACGVVLFALATRVLPFDADVSRFYLSSTSDEKRGRDPSPGAHSIPEKKDTKRSYMLRIANGEYHWPGDASRSHRHYPVPSMPGSPYRPHAGSSTVSSRRSSLASSDDWYRSGIQHAVFFSEGVPVPSTSGASQRHAPSVATSTPPSSVVGESSAEHDALSAALKSHQLLSPSHAHFPASASDASHSHRPRSSVEHHPPPDLVTAGLKRIVGRLLVRDPRKRARVMDLWTDEWMRGEGAPLPPPEALLGDEDDPLDPFSLSHPYSEPHPDFGYRTGVGLGDVDTQYLRARCLSDASMNAESGHVSPIGAGPSRPLSATYGGGLIYEMPPSSVHRRSASGRLVVGRGGIPPVAKQDVTSPP